MYFLIWLEDGSSRARHQEGWFLVRLFFLSSHDIFTRCFLYVPEERENCCIFLSFYKYISLIRLRSHTYDLNLTLIHSVKALSPNTVTSGLGLPHMNLGKHELVHNIAMWLISFKSSNGIKMDFGQMDF